MPRLSGASPLCLLHAGLLRYRVDFQSMDAPDEDGEYQLDESEYI